MSQKNVGAADAIQQSVSARESIGGEGSKDRTNDSVEPAQAPRETSVSQNEVVAEKIVSAKDGTVTQTQVHYGNVSANNIASTKYQDDLSSGGLKSEDNPSGIQHIAQSTAIVGRMSINATPVVDPEKHNKTVEHEDQKRETNPSQNTMMGENPTNVINQTEDGSQMVIDGISIPDNGSTLNKVSQDIQRDRNNSSIQQQPGGAFGLPTETLPEHHNPYDQANSNNQFKQVGVTQPIYSAHINRNDEQEVSAKQKGQIMHKRLIDRKKQQASFPVKVADLNSMVQIRKKKPKMKYNDRLIYRSNQERQIYSQQVQSRLNAGKAQARQLDGFLLLFSCRVKLPHEAIRSKLAGMNINDVTEEDLEFFKNLTYLDISDNQVQMHQLINLVALQELDLQYNSMDQLQLQMGCFPNLHTLHLSYNQIPPGHLQDLGYLPELQILNLGSNGLTTLPTDMSFFHCLEELNLSANNFSSHSTLVDPAALFKALSTIPMLKKLNLSRNKFVEFHSSDLPQHNSQLPLNQQCFPYLEELYFAFNEVPHEEKLFYAVAELPALKFLVITGNPFALQQDQPQTTSALQPYTGNGQVHHTQTLQLLLEQKGGQLVNETLNPPAYLKRSTGTSAGLGKTMTTRGTTAGNMNTSSRQTAFQNMVNYGNSKALVAVNDDQTGSQRTQTNQLSSAPALSMSTRENKRPGNPGFGGGQAAQAWGQIGSVLGGEPLAIEYNQDVLEDKPTQMDNTTTEGDRIETEMAAQRHSSKQMRSDNQGGAPQQRDGFFITEDLNQQEKDQVEMVPQNEADEKDQEMTSSELRSDPAAKKGAAFSDSGKEPVTKRIEKSAADVQPEEFGRWKMDKFKEFAREILLPVKPQPKKQQVPKVKGGLNDIWGPQLGASDDRQTMSQQSARNEDRYNYDLQEDGHEFMQQPTVDANGDILYAYKELKKILIKNQGSKMGTDHTEGPKNYLRTTIAMQQHSVKRMNKELLRYSLQQPRGAGGPRMPGAAPRTAVGGSRTRPPITGAFTQARNSNHLQPTSVSSNPLLPKITSSQRPALAPPRASTANHVGSRPTRYGSQNVKEYGRPPCWRKTKQQQVDERVGSLFESYKAIDKAAHMQRMNQGYAGTFKNQTNEQIKQDMINARRKQYFQDE